MMASTAWGRTSSTAETPESSLRPRELIIPQKSLDTDNDIPSIPDIDELSETSKDVISSTSKISVNQSAMYQELDSELLKQNAFVALDGINLTPLLKFFHPDVNIKEADTPWTIDSLFKDLSEYYQNENAAS